MRHKIIGVAALCLLFSEGVVQASAPVYPLKASSNGRYLIDQNNVPFLMVGDSPQALIGNLSVANATTYLADRKAKGFNALWVNLLCSQYTFCNADGSTLDGIKPFTSGTEPSSYDLATPNPAFFARADTMIQAAAAQGITLLLDPIETGSWLVALQDNGATKAFNFGVFLGNRYKNFPNIVWMSGNDFQTWRTSSDNNLVKQVMAGIASVDPNHLQTIELDYNVSYSNQDAALGSFLGVDAAYTYYETYADVLAAYNSSPVLPVFMVESNYEFEDNTGGGGGTTANLRRQEYWTMTSGATGQLYGNHYTTDGSWVSNSGKLDTPGMTQLGYVTALFAPRSWWLLVPDQTHKVVTAGFGTPNASNNVLANSHYVTTASPGDGSLAISYCPNSCTLTVDMTKMAGSTTARWYDPANGTFSSISGSPFANTGTHQFASPGNNSDGDGDWVLVLETSAAPPPPPTFSPCDVNQSGAVDVADVQKEVNMDLQVIPCTNPSGQCSVIQVQRVVNAALGGVCVSP